MTILQQISFFFFEVVVIDAWSIYFVELLCRLVCQTHNIVPHISLHDPPYRRTTKRYTDFPSMGNFSVAPAEIQDSNMVLLLSTVSLLVWHCL